MLNDLSAADSGYWHEPDALLVDIVSGFVNKGGMELGVTLFIRGLVISGVLVGEREYLRAISEMFRSQAKRTLLNPTKQEMQMTDEIFDFTNVAEDIVVEDLYDDPAIAQRLVEEAQDEDELDDMVGVPAIRYLHLKDPAVIQPQPAVSFSHSSISILRIRLTAVDGWMLGKVTVDDDDDLMNFPPPAPNEIRH